MSINVCFEIQRLVLHISSRAWAPGMSASVTRLGVVTRTPRRASSRSRCSRRVPPRAMPTRAAYGARAPSCPADVDAAFVSLPVLSLPKKGCDAATERAFAISLREVCHQVGFFYITDIDHVLKETTRAGALGAARRFFSMDDATKNKMNMKSSPAFRGYVSLGAENTAGEPDFREQVEFGVERSSVVVDVDSKAPPPPYDVLCGPNQWPSESDCPEFRTEIETFLEEAEVLSIRIMELLALSLDQPRDYFDSTFGDEPNVQTKIARYPAVIGCEEGDESVTPQTQTFGVGAHTDSGFLSLLLQDDVDGLQVQNGNGQWVDAPPVEGSLVVNLGEMLQLVTGGYYLATPHRVVNQRLAPVADADTEETAKIDRISVPYFFNPKLSYVASPIDLQRSLPWRRAKPDTVRATESHGFGGNSLFETYGANALKSLARSHPEVTRRHHPGLAVLKNGNVVTREKRVKQ